MSATAATAPQKTVGASIGRNTLFGVIASAVQVATRLVTVPIVVRHLGLSGYGIWSIILTTAAYMRFGSVGVKSAFQKYVAEATGNGNYQRASELLSTGTAIMGVLSLLVLVPISLFSTAIAQKSGIPPEFLHASALSIGMLAIIIAFANVGASFEAIVMGGHRIDLSRKMGTFLSLGEAIAIVTVLRLGYGLLAMSIVMAASEIAYIVYCYFIAKRVVPEISLKLSNVRSAVVGELFRFAGSYQLVSILQLTYSTLAPLAILKAFGAEASGVYAIANRVVSPVTMGIYAFIVPILSSSAMVFASGSDQGIRDLLNKSIRYTLLLTVLPLAAVCAFGGDLVTAWTGQQNAEFPVTIYAVAVTTLAYSVGLLSLVLYRATGKAVLDNLKELLRLVILVPVAIYAKQLGYVGVLSGIATAEIAGAILMVFALKRTFHTFSWGSVISPSVRLVVVSGAVVAIGWIAGRFLVFPSLDTRLAAAARTGVSGLATLVTAIPLFLFTGILSKSELRNIFGALRLKK